MSGTWAADLPKLERIGQAILEIPSDDEVNRILTAASKAYRSRFAIMADAGRRPNEVPALRRRDIAIRRDGVGNMLETPEQPSKKPAAQRSLNPPESLRLLLSHLRDLNPRPTVYEMGGTHGFTMQETEDGRTSRPQFPPGATVEWRAMVSRQQPPQCGIETAATTDPAVAAAEMSRLRRLLGMAADVIQRTNGLRDVGFVMALREAAGMPLVPVRSEGLVPEASQDRVRVEPTDRDANSGA